MTENDLNFKTVATALAAAALLSSASYAGATTRYHRDHHERPN